MPTFLFNRRWTKVLVSTTIFTLVLLFYYRVENGRHMMHETALNAAAKGFTTDADGFMAIPEAEEYCRAHKWKPYPERSMRRKVYDLFMLNTAGLAGDPVERAERPRRLLRHFRVRIDVHRAPETPISQGQLGTLLGLSRSDYTSGVE
jgi:hypothetical protein